MTQSICVSGDHQTLRFAADELARYLELATGAPLEFDGAAPLFTLTVADDSIPYLSAGFGPEDDWIVIRPQGEGYLLAGSNPRSVLFAVYRYLRELGFRWVRPGPNGEIIPRLESPIAAGLDIVERASYRYRTITIEGACSEEHVRNLIDWMAKRGMNGYFIQFDYGTCFWERWYAHADNPYIEAEPLDREGVEGIVARVVQDLKLRDMRFERMGHGWTAGAVGLPGEGWGEEQIDLSEEQRQMLAELDGKRDLFHGVPLNTNLCYSNPDVRRRMTDNIVAYARAHPEVDTLHLWLADGSNNNCECDTCREARPSDFYVELMNELDDALARAGLDARIVFLVYVDLLWPPLKQRIKNPGRFVLMFAPITRTFQRSFAGETIPGLPLPEYVRNRLEFPKDVGLNIQFLGAWQEQFKGDGFDFDYHNIWACHFDPSQHALARVLHRDIQGLGDIDLHGLNSCQVQRLSFPHNLLLDVLAETLWDKDRSFEDIARRTFSDAYGEDGGRAEEFFSTMSGLCAPFFEPVFIPDTDRLRIAQGLANLDLMPALIGQMRSTVQRNLQHPEQAVRFSWQYLETFLDLLDLMVEAWHAYLERSDACRAAFEKVFDFAWRNEEALHEGWDVATFVKVQKWRIHEAEEGGQAM